MTTWIVPRGFPVRAARPSSFDRLVDELWKGFDAPLARPAEAPVWRPRIDLRESEGQIVVSAELPGLEEKDIEVHLEDDALTLRGERAAHEAPDEGRWHRVETFRGRFERSLHLPAKVDADAVKAVYRRGILTVTLPKAAEARMRNVPITGPEDARAS